MKIWFCSDNHFGHKNIHKFCPKTRPDADHKVMDQKMILRWQEQVGPEDEVWALGDFFFHRSEEARKILPRLPGRKHFVWGNHDKTIETDHVLANQFETIHEYKELKFGGNTFVLFHYPIQEWNKMHHGAIHLYGHIHDKLSNVGGKAINVCIDSPEMQTDVPYSLYSLEDVLRLANTKELRAHHGKVIL